MRGSQLKNELVLGAEVDLLHVLALVQIPEMQLAAIAAVEQDFRHQAVLESIGRPPLAGDERVLAQMPPAIVRELLRAPVQLPPAKDLEAFMIDEEDSARRLALAIGKRHDIDALRPAMDGVRA